MPKRHVSPGKPPIDMVWFKQRFDELERQHAMIVHLLKGGNIIPELEAQIRKAMLQVLKIDWKVKDEQSSPNKQHTIGEN